MLEDYEDERRHHLRDHKIEHEMTPRAYRLLKMQRQLAQLVADAALKEVSHTLDELAIHSYDYSDACTCEEFDVMFEGLAVLYYFLERYGVNINAAWRHSLPEHPPIPAKIFERWTRIYAPEVFFEPTLFEQ